MQKSNIFKQLQSLKASRTDRLNEAQVATIAGLRSDKTHADESKLFIWLILIVLTGYIFWSDYSFYSYSFVKTISPGLSDLLAVAIALVVEIAAIKLMLRFMRSIVFLWIIENWWNAGYWLFIGLLAGGATFWSYNISTKGMELYSEQKGFENEQFTPLSDRIQEATASIDGQIAAQIEVQQDAQSNKVKSGKYKGITYIAHQKTATEAGKTINSLQEQRAKIVEMVSAEYNKERGRSDKKITSFSKFIEQYGGYAEIARLLCMFGIVFYERRLVEMFKNGEFEEQDSNQGGSATPAGVKTGSGASLQHNGAQFQNSTGGGFQAHYFNKDRNSGSVQTSPGSYDPPTNKKTVAHRATEKMVTDSDAVLSNAITRCQRELSNFKSGNGTPATVGKRLSETLDNAANTIVLDGFLPSPELALKAASVFGESLFALESRKLPFSDRPHHAIEQLKQYYQGATA